MAGKAIRANLVPGLFLQALMAVFIFLYLKHEGTRHFLAEVATLKQRSGYLFAFTSYVFSSALLPEILRVGFQQGGRVTRRNIRDILTGAPAWGAFGIYVDSVYHFQALMFGPGNDWHTVLLKVFVDQFVLNPLINAPFCVGYFAWRDAGFRRSAVGEIFNRQFFSSRVFPILISGWCIWVPGVCLIYAMPLRLQFPVAALLQCFWVMVFTLVNRAQAAPAVRDTGLRINSSRT